VLPTIVLNRWTMGEILPEDNALSSSFRKDETYATVGECFDQADLRTEKQLRRRAKFTLITGQVKASLSMCPEFFGISPCASTKETISAAEDYAAIGDELTNVLQPNCDKMAAEQILNGIAGLNETLNGKFGELNKSLIGMETRLGQTMRDVLLPTHKLASETLAKVDKSMQESRDSEHRLARGIHEVKETTDAILLRLEKLHQGVKRNHLELLQNRYSTNMLEFWKVVAKMSGAESNIIFALSQFNRHQAALSVVGVTEGELQSWLEIFELRREQSEYSLRASWTTIRDGLALVASLVDSDFLHLHYELTFKHSLHNHLNQLQNCAGLNNDNFVSQLHHLVRVEALGTDSFLLSLTSMVTKAVGISSLISGSFPTDVAMVTDLDESLMAIAESLEQYKSRATTDANSFTDLLQSELPSYCAPDPGCIIEAAKMFPNLEGGLLDLGGVSVGFWSDDRLEEYSCKAHPPIQPANNIPDILGMGPKNCPLGWHPYIIRVQCPPGYVVPSRWFVPEGNEGLLENGQLNMTCKFFTADHGYDPTVGGELPTVWWWEVAGKTSERLENFDQYGPFGCTYTGSPWARQVAYVSERLVDQKQNLFDGADLWASIISGMQAASEEFHSEAVRRQHELVSHGKVASQSTTTHHEWVASNALDGNYNPFPNGSSCTHTVSGVAGWWRVDLGRIYSIAAVRITARGDRWGKRLLINPNVTVTGGPQDVSKIYEGMVPQGKNAGVVLFDPVVIGSSVVISVNGILSMCEVEVIARK